MAIKTNTATVIKILLDAKNSIYVRAFIAQISFLL